MDKRKSVPNSNKSELEEGDEAEMRRSHFTTLDLKTIGNTPLNLSKIKPSKNPRGFKLNLDSSVFKGKQEASMKPPMAQPEPRFTFETITTDQNVKQPKKKKLVHLPKIQQMNTTTINVHVDKVLGEKKDSVSSEEQVVRPT